VSSACRAAFLALALAGCKQAPRYAEVRAIVDRHCLSCHSEHNTSRVFPLAPSGVSFDDAASLRRHAARIRQRTCVDRTMPLLDKTQMSEAERTVIDRWVRAGAPAE
jgi:uncharacterized membrane protein